MLTPRSGDGRGGAGTKLGGVVEAGGLRAPGLRDTASDVAGEDHKRLGRSRVPRRRTIPAEGQLTVVEISAEIRRRAAVKTWLGHRLRFRETQGRGCVLKRRNGAGFGVRVTELRRLRIGATGPALSVPNHAGFWKVRLRRSWQR